MVPEAPPAETEHGLQPTGDPGWYVVNAREAVWRHCPAILSLTVLRMVPVAIALLGTGARRPTVAFLGWFGPRGAASIVFALLLVEEGADLPHEDVLLTTAFVTVGLSVLAHGVSAAPLANRYADWLDAHPPDRAVDVEDGVGVPGLRWRLAREEGPA